ncbi:MAG: glycosyltransferase family 4 protein [Candidatus Nanoarchaeia archaeon]
MKILFVNAHIGKGGGQAIQSTQLIKEIGKNHEVKLLTLKHKLNLVTPPKDTEYVGRFHFPLGIYYLYKRLKKINKKYDIIVALDPYFSLPIVSLIKKPKIIRLGIDPIEDLKIRNKKIFLVIYRLIFKSLLKKYSAVICNNRILKEKYKNFNTYFIPNGYDISKFNTESKVKSRKRLNLPNNKFILLYTGKIIPRKNLELLFKSLGQLNDIKLVIVGNKNEEHYGTAYFDYLVKKYNSVLNKVIFVDEQPPDKITYFLNAADIFVFPSLLEGSPNSVLEAMGSKLPVLCLNTPEHKEIIKHKSTGILFKNEDHIVRYVNLLIYNLNHSTTVFIKVNAVL